MRNGYQCLGHRESHKVVVMIRLYITCQFGDPFLSSLTWVRATYMQFHPAGSCWHCIFPRIWTYPPDSCTSQSRPSTPVYHLHLLSARIPPDDRSGHESHGRDETWIRGRASLAARAEHYLIPIHIMLAQKLFFLHSFLSLSNPCSEKQAGSETQSDQETV